MPRIIKFRAWDKRFKKMYIGDIRVVLSFPDSDIEIMQFIGLHDKNGKEIWEGDIVKHPDARNYLMVTWIQPELAFKLIRRDKIISLGTLNDKYEIIGNIYENPKLVEDR